MKWWRWSGFGLICFLAGFLFHSQLRDPGQKGSEFGFRETKALQPVLPEGQSAAKAAGSQDDRQTGQLSGEASVEQLRDLLSETRYERGRVAVHQLLSGYAIGDIRRLATQVESVSGDLKTIRLRGILYERWADLDPHQLLAHAVDLPSGIASQAVRAALQGLVRQSPEAAVTAYRALGLREKALARQYVAYALADSAPDLALEVLQETPGDGNYFGVFNVIAEKVIRKALEALTSVEGHSERGFATRAIARQWAIENWTDAFAWAQDMTNISHREDALAEVIHSAVNGGHFGAVLEKVSDISNDTQRSQLIEFLVNQGSHSDPDRAWAYLERLDPEKQRALSSSIASSLASNDPHRALKFAESLPVGGMRDSFIFEAVGNLAAYDIEAARQAFDGVEVGSQRSAATALLEQWSKRDPAGAAKFIDAHPDVVPEEFLGKVASEWTLRDPEGALAWIGRFGDDAKRMAALEASLQSHARTDPDVATDYVLGFEDRDRRDKLLGSLAKELVTEDFGFAMKWLHTLPEDARQVATGPVISRTISIDPAQAARLFDDLVQTPGAVIDSDVAGRIGGSWAMRAPGEASRWAAGLEDPDAQQAAIETVANSWLKNDPMAASQWVSRLPPGSPRDAATVRLVGHVQNEDPEAGFVWALTIDNSASRQQALEGLIRSWSSRDPVSGRTAVEAAGLEVTDPESLIKLLDP